MKVEKRHNKIGEIKLGKKAYQIFIGNKLDDEELSIVVVGKKIKYQKKK